MTTWNHSHEAMELWGCWWLRFHSLATWNDSDEAIVIVMKSWLHEIIATKPGYYEHVDDYDFMPSLHEMIVMKP